MNSLEELECQARELSKAGRYDEVVMALNRAIVAIDAHNGPAFTRLGRALEETGDLPGARKAYECALSVCPSSSVAKSRLEGLAKKVRRERDAEAISAITDFREAYDCARVARDDAKYQLALVALARAETLALSGGDRAKVHLTRASVLRAMGRAAEAIDEAKKGLAGRPTALIAGSLVTCLIAAHCDAQQVATAVDLVEANETQRGSDSAFLAAAGRAYHLLYVETGDREWLAKSADCIQRGGCRGYWKANKARVLSDLSAEIRHCDHAGATEDAAQFRWLRSRLDDA